MSFPELRRRSSLELQPKEFQVFYVHIARRIHDRAREIASLVGVVLLFTMRIMNNHTQPI